MSAPVEWSKKDLWTRRGNGFLVQVSRHGEAVVERMFGAQGAHRWCVYAYVYPEHPYFARLAVPDGRIPDAAFAMPIHGTSFFQVHRYPDDSKKAGEVSSYQVGGDYNHLHDDHFTFMATKEEASSVFDDAEELIEWLGKYVPSVISADSPDWVSP